MEETENTGVVQNQESDTAVKTYTQEEVDKLLQQETDRRVTSALKKQQEKFNEAQKLQTMNETQKQEYEFEKRVKEFEAREKEFNLTQNKLSATKVMADKNLPVAFVDYIVADDAETMMTNIDNFEKAWNTALSEAINNKLSSKAPKNGNVSEGAVSKEQFKKMTLQQQAELYKNNPELYKALI